MPCIIISVDLFHLYALVHRYTFPPNCPVMMCHFIVYFVPFLCSEIQIAYTLTRVHLTLLCLQSGSFKASYCTLKVVAESVRIFGTQVLAFILRCSY